MPKVTFKQAMIRINEVAGNNADKLHKQFSVDMLQEFAIDTPVDTGLATGNWILKGGKPNLSPVKFKDLSITGILATGRAKKAARGIPAGQDIYVSNAVQGKDANGGFTGKGYIIKLEHGFSRQAPNGMFLNTVVRAKSILKQSKKKVFK